MNEIKVRNNQDGTWTVRAMLLMGETERKVHEHSYTTRATDMRDVLAKFKDYCKRGNYEIVE